MIRRHSPFETEPQTATTGAGTSASLKILVAGRPGAGKTTVVLRTVERLAAVAGGFYTEEIRESGRRLGFRVRDIVSGEEAVLSHVDFGGRHRVGRYGVDVESFDRVGVAALEQALVKNGCVVIDEIGKMELFSQRFQKAVEQALAAALPLLATVPAYRLPFTDALKRRPDTDVIEVTPSNREALPEALAGRLNRALRDVER